MKPESAMLTETATPLLIESFAINVTHSELQVIVCAFCDNGAKRSARRMTIVLRLVFMTVEFNCLVKCTGTQESLKGVLHGRNGKLFTLHRAVMYGRITGFGFKPLCEVGTVGKSESERNFFNRQISVKQHTF